MLHALTLLAFCPSGHHINIPEGAIVETDLSTSATLPCT